MKQIIITIIKFIRFFIRWAILTFVLPLSASENPAIWRLWAEIMPLLTMIAFTFIFWLIEKKTVRLYLFDNPVRGVVIGTVTGIIWLAIPVLVMYTARIIHFGGTKAIQLLSVWMMTAFLNVIMQELLVRGYLYQMIKQKHNIVAATIVTTVLFTALHGGALVLGGVSLADDYPNLYITAFTGNDILSGGSCKIEGSIIVLFVNIILITFFGYLKNKRIS